MDRDQLRRRRSVSGGSGEHRSALQPKVDDNINVFGQEAEAGEFLSLTRCAGCYNQDQKFSTHQRGDESSSTSEDSGSEAESSSSSSCDHSLSETEEEPEGREDAPGSAVGGEEEKEMEEMSSRREEAHRISGRAPLVKCVTLPCSPTPHLLPASLLPRPPRVVSVLNLQVLLHKPSSDTSPIHPHPSPQQHTTLPWGLSQQQNVQGQRSPPPL